MRVEGEWGNVPIRGWITAVSFWIYWKGLEMGNGHVLDFLWLGIEELGLRNISGDVVSERAPALVVSRLLLPGYSEQVISVGIFTLTFPIPPLPWASRPS